MSDMFTAITIENPNPYWGQDGETTLSDFEGEFETHWDQSDPDANVEGIAGWSKYQIDTLAEFAHAYSGVNADAIVTIREEWTGEGGPDITETVWQGGEVRKDASTHSTQVPDNLHELVKAVREALPELDKFDPAMALSSATRALLDALDPEGASK